MYGKTSTFLIHNRVKLNSMKCYLTNVEEQTNTY